MESKQRDKGSIYLYDQVSLKGGYVGIIKYIGYVLPNLNNIHIGVDLAKGKGSHNGILKKNYYFKTIKNKKTGKFFLPSKIMYTIQS